MERVRRLTYLCAVLAVLLSHPVAARAQTGLEQAEAAATAAREAYLVLDLEVAQARADEAVRLCEEGGCATPVMARYYVLQGMIEHAATQDAERTRAMFRQAVHTDPAVELDPELATPDLQAILIDAREDVHIDGALSPEAVAARHTEEAPGGRDGAMCRTDDTCHDGYICEESICVVGERPEPPEPWQRVFLEVGFNAAMASATDDLRADVGADAPAPDADPNDALVPCAGASDETCVRVTEGLFVFAPGIHVGIGAYLTERFGLSVRARIGLGSSGRDAFSFLQVGLRLHYRFVVPHSTGFHLGAFLGGSVGQVQVRPEQRGEDINGNPVDDVWAKTGLGGVDLGLNVGYRFHDNVGIFVQPGVYALFPDVSFGLQATVGIDLAFGETGGAEPEPAPIVEPPPDQDRDGDRIYNEDDLCPDEAEDVDGFEDEDGCPELDNDQDGILDTADRCPREPEDFDQFEDEDGCPERDNDGDGVDDADDACPLEVGVGIAHGCPEPDRDGDGVVDRLDNCPDEIGTIENYGCNEQQFVQIQEDRLVITDVIYFRTNRDVIENRSYPLLAQIASVLNSHPEIAHVRIEGHTDNRGNDRNNMRLSERRARAVMQHLVRQGHVDAQRLTSHGYGSTQPIVENAEAEEEHAQNRRVEFVILHE